MTPADMAARPASGMVDQLQSAYSAGNNQDQGVKMHGQSQAQMAPLRTNMPQDQCQQAVQPNSPQYQQQRPMRQQQQDSPQQQHSPTGPMQTHALQNQLQALQQQMMLMQQQQRQQQQLQQLQYQTHPDGQPQQEGQHQVAPQQQQHQQPRLSRQALQAHLQELQMFLQQQPQPSFSDDRAGYAPPQSPGASPPRTQRPQFQQEKQDRRPTGKQQQKSRHQQQTSPQDPLFAQQGAQLRRLDRHHQQQQQDLKQHQQQTSLQEQQQQLQQLLAQSVRQHIEAQKLEDKEEEERRDRQRHVRKGSKDSTAEPKFSDQQQKRRPKQEPRAFSQKQQLLQFQREQNQRPQQKFQPSQQQPQQPQMMQQQMMRPGLQQMCDDGSASASPRDQLHTQMMAWGSIAATPYYASAPSDDCFHNDHTSDTDEERYFNQFCGPGPGSSDQYGKQPKQQMLYGVPQPAQGFAMSMPGMQHPVLPSQQMTKKQADYMARGNGAAVGRPQPAPTTTANCEDPQANAGCRETMKSQLQALQCEDPAQVFIVRRINKLGFSSADYLRAFFSRYGEVKEVHVSHSRVKSLRPVCDRRCPNVPSQWRLRAAALGFVVMQSSEVTSRIIADGPEHEVNGKMVHVHPFHRRNTSLEDGDLADGNASKVDQQGRFDASTEHGCDPECLGSQSMVIREGFPSMHGFMYVSEQDLQDAMPQRYED